MKSDETSINPLRHNLRCATSTEVEATEFVETFQGFPLRGSCHKVTDEVS